MLFSYQSPSSIRARTTLRQVLCTEAERRATVIQVIPIETGFGVYHREQRGLADSDSEEWTLH
jgi:hypothetical protein